MFSQSKKLQDLRDLRALDKISQIIHLQGCLTRIRNGNPEEAINGLEIALDCSVDALVQEIEGCGSNTRIVVDQILQRVSSYRQQFPGPTSAYFEGLDPDTRQTLLI